MAQFETTNCKGTVSSINNNYDILIEGVIAPEYTTDPFVRYSAPAPTDTTANPDLHVTRHDEPCASSVDGLQLPPHPRDWNTASAGSLHDRGAHWIATSSSGTHEPLTNGS